MKRGAAPKFKELGSSPFEYEKDPKEFIKRKSKENLEATVNIGPKVDPDAPGKPGTPGFEPPVTRSDFDEGSEQQKMFDDLNYEKHSDLEKYDDDK